MKKIVLVGLIYDENLGDQLIYDCCRHYVQKWIDSQNLKMKIVSLDLYGRSTSLMDNIIQAKVESIKYRINSFSNWEELALYNLRKKVQVIDKNTVAVIFVGGGLLKPHNQYLMEPMLEVLERSSLFDIPVMFSSVGVEGFDENDLSCVYLKKLLNYNNIKYVTTRDDIETLRNSYIISDSIVTELVSDIATSVSRLYPKIHKQSNNKIGLGVGRKGIFQDYGLIIDENTIDDFWIQIYSLLSEQGYQCEFFTNGYQGDYLKTIEIVNKIEKRFGVLPSIAPNPKNARQLVNIISNYQAVIATRLHSTIVAYSYDIPFLGLVWNQKQTFFGKIIGRESSFINITLSTPEVVLQILDEELNKSPKFNSAYVDSAPKYIIKFLDEFVKI